MQSNEFLDEGIVEMIDQAEQGATAQSGSDGGNTEKSPLKAEQSIYTGVKMQGLWVEFHECQFVSNKITMMVPVDFEEMEPEQAKAKYPMEQRPETILTDITGAINILFRYMGDPVTNEEIESVRDALLAIMCRMNPGIKKQSTGLEIVSGKNIAYAEFTNPVMDGKLYNLMYFLEVEGKTLMGGFNCPSKSAKFWRNPALEMMQSIQIKETEEVETNE